MSVLLLAEVNNGELAMDATAKAVTAAQSSGMSQFSRAAHLLRQLVRQRRRSKA